jgi:hypothetical protein
MSDTAQATSRNMRAAQSLSIIIFGALLLWPIAVVAFRGDTLTGAYEESIGYRYFYNLRQLYDPAEFLFLPQGQFTDLLQKGIHLLLSATGHPPDQLMPRIDRFAYLSLLLFHLISIGSFAWLITAMRSPAAVFLQVAYWAVPAYILLAGNLLLQADYPSIELAFALFAAGYIARIDKPFDWSTGHAVAMGVFLGVAAGTKISLMLFPATVIGFALLSSRDEKIGRYAAIGALTGLIVWALIMVVALTGRRTFMGLYFSQLAGFLRNPGGVDLVQAQHPWPLWTIDRFVAEPLPIAIVYLTPIIAIAGLIGATRKTWGLVIVLTAGAIVSNFFLSKRDYPITLVEAGLYLALVIWCIGAKIWTPAIVKTGYARALPLLASAAIVALSLALANYSVYPQGLLAIVSHNSAYQRDFAKLKSENPGKHLWIVPTNHVRPFTIDSAIMKGGANSFGQWMVPESPIMRKMFPDLDFSFMDPALTEAKISQYDRVFFAFNSDDQTEAAQLRASASGMKIGDWACIPVFRFPWQRIAMCKPPQRAGQ